MGGTKIIISDVRILYKYSGTFHVESVCLATCFVHALVLLLILVLAIF